MATKTVKKTTKTSGKVPSNDAIMGMIAGVVKPPKAVTPPKASFDKQREMLSKMTGDFKVTPQTSWTKVTGKEKSKRVSLSNKGVQIHANFEVKSPHVESITADEAKKRHIGGVRSILWLDRQTDANLKGAFTMMLKGLNE